jgi:hypothetical protein
VRKNGESKGFTQEEKDAMPMRNAAIDKLNSLVREQKIESGYKKVNDAELLNPYAKPREGKYSISKEFDGKEVEGTLSMKKNILGKTVGVEKFNFPNGGTRVERTVYNNEGRPTKRTTKDKKIN